MQRLNHDQSVGHDIGYTEIRVPCSLSVINEPVSISQNKNSCDSGMVGYNIKTIAAIVPCPRDVALEGASEDGHERPDGEDGLQDGGVHMVLRHRCEVANEDGQRELGEV